METEYYRVSVVTDGQSESVMFVPVGLVTYLGGAGLSAKIELGKVELSLPKGPARQVRVCRDGRKSKVMVKAGTGVRFDLDSLEGSLIFDNGDQGKMTIDVVFPPEELQEHLDADVLILDFVVSEF